MKPKTTLILVVVLAVVGLFYYFWGVKGEAERQLREEQASLLIPVEQDSVNSVAIIQHGDSIITYRRVNGTWQITFPVVTGADQDKINRNLEAYLTAEKNRTIATELTDLKPYGLDKPQAEIHLTYNDTAQAVLLIGDENPTQSGVFVKRGDHPGIYTSDKKLLTEGNKQLFDLRDRSLLHFAQDEISKIILNREGQSNLEFTKVGNTWRINEPQVRLQNSQVTALLRSLSSGQAQKYFEERADNLGAYGIDRPSILVSLFRNDSTRAATLAIGNPVDDLESPKYYAKDLERPMVFSVNNALVNKLQQTAFNFQDKKLFDFNRNQVTDIEITWEDTTYQLTKIDTAWQLIQPVASLADQQKAEGLARTLSTLRLDDAETFSESPLAQYGLNNPWLQVTFGISGSEFDGFLIGKTVGDNMRYVKLQSSPYVYKIKESKVREFQVTSGGLIQEALSGSVN